MWRVWIKDVEGVWDGVWGFRGCVCNLNLGWIPVVLGDEDIRTHFHLQH